MTTLRFHARPREYVADIFDPADMPEGVVDCGGDGYAVRLSGVLVPVNPGDLLFRTAYGLQPMSWDDALARFVMLQPEAPEPEPEPEAPAPRVSIWGRARAWFRR